MGAGKSEVARELANKLNSEWLDLDALLEEAEKRTPAQIIKGDGEKRFRDLESAMLRTVLTTMEQQVIALGGGTWIAEANRQLLTVSKTLTIWLNVPFDVCWRRIIEAGDARPLAPTREAAQKLYNERYPIYAMADVCIEVAPGESASTTAAKIAAILRHRAQI